MFEILDEAAFLLFKGLNLEQVMSWKNGEWKCTTENGYFMNVRIKGGIVHMEVAETENELHKYENLVLKIKSPNKWDEIGKYFLNPIVINFKEIMEFMEWNCEPDQIWDE